MFLQRVRAHCNQKLEEAIYQLYNFASLNECSLPLHEITYATTLQENMIAVAKESELQVRPIVRSAHIIHESRTHNVAIKSKHDIRLSVLLQKLPSTKLDEYDKNPLASQLGFIHAIPEAEFDIAIATITDVGFLGFFPKKLFQAMRKYASELERCNAPGSTDFLILMDGLIAAFVYRPITISAAYYKQKVSFITQCFVLMDVTCVLDAAMSLLNNVKSYNWKMKC